MILGRSNLTQMQLYYVKTKTNVMSHLHIVRLSPNYKNITMTTNIRYRLNLYHNEVIIRIFP